MSVVGFDVGNQTCFIAVARGGGIETIANEYSDRKTPSYVSFGQKQRQLGVDAKNQERTNARNTISQFKRLIGRTFSDVDVQNELKRKIPYQIIEQPGGKIGIKVKCLGKDDVFSPEQTMAMLLSKLKATAEVGIKAKVVDCVISVPTYYNDQQRRAMLDSAYMAGLNCLRLMNDTTAAALTYGIYKQDLPEENAKSRNIVFVDMGHSSLQTALAAYNKGKLKILTTATDSSLGGRDFDAELVDYFCKDFETRFKMNVKENIKAHLRLGAEAEKLKKVMSSNTADLPMNIDCFLDDKDVVGRMKRETFESLCAHLFVRVENCLRQLLESSGLKVDDIDGIEVVGGSTRIPAIKNFIKKVFGKDVSTTLNGDEAVARGCALQCAMLSPTFRVREFNVQDVTTYPIKLSWQSVGEEDCGSMDVCESGHTFPFLKQLTFYRKEPFDLNGYYANGNSQTLIGRFSVKNVTPNKQGESSKIKVKIRMDIHGIFYVSKAQMIEKIPEEESSTEPVETQPTSAGTDSNMENGPDDTSTEGNKETNTKEGDTAPVPMDVDENSTNEGTNGDKNDQEKTPDTEASINGEEPSTKQETAQKPSDGAKSEPKSAKKKKPTVKTIELQVEHFVSSLPQDQLNKAIEKESELIMRDKEEDDRVHSRNAVEEYVLQTRSKLYQEYEKFVTEEDRDSFVIKLEDTENWLYEDGEDEKKSVYKDKLAQLIKIGDPINLRYQESITRPQALESLGHELQLCKKVLDLYQQKDEKYEHLEAGEIKKVEDAVQEKEKWLNETWNKLNSQAPHQTPAVLTAAIVQEKQKFEKFYKPIVNKPKPKAKEEPPKDEKKEDEGKDDVKMEDKNPQEETKENKTTNEENEKNNADMDVD